jgi:hypothetical protein
MERICLPLHKGFGLTIAGIGRAPSHLGTHNKIFWTWLSSKKVSRRVNFRMPHRVSWTIPITGLIDCGDMIYDKIDVMFIPA